MDHLALTDATRRQKTVPLDSGAMLTARDMGINFGDEMPTFSAIGR